MRSGSIILSESLVRSDKFLSNDDEMLVNPFADSDNQVATEVAPPQLERADFPNVKFWFKHDWLKKVGTEAAKVFVETEHGKAVNVNRLDDIRKYARKFWHTIDKGSAPPTWRQAPIEMKQMYYGLMIEKFPELKLCDNNWKADQIAATNYNSWHSYWVKRLVNEVQMKPSKRRKITSSVSRISGSLFHFYFSKTF